MRNPFNFSLPLLLALAASTSVLNADPVRITNRTGNTIWLDLNSSFPEGMVVTMNVDVHPVKRTLTFQDDGKLRWEWPNGQTVALQEPSGASNCLAFFTLEDKDGTKLMGQTWDLVCLMPETKGAAPNGMEFLVRPELVPMHMDPHAPAPPKPKVRVVESKDSSDGKAAKGSLEYLVEASGD